MTMNTNERELRKHGLFGGALLMAGVAALAGAEAATADVLYDTFGPNGEFNPDNRWISGFQGNYETWNAMPFEIGAGTFNNVSITVPLTWQNSSNPESFSFQLKLYADDGMNQNVFGDPVEGGPGTLIESPNGTAADLPQWLPDQLTFPTTTFEFENAVLQGNTKYWLALEAERPPDGAINWHQNTIDHQDFISQRTVDNFGSFPDLWSVFHFENVTGAMRIDATNIPAPGAVVPLIAAGALAGRRRRRRIDGTQVHRDCH
jgi:hypothetical protein